MELRAVVVIPARDEAQRIGDCLQALAGQTVPRGCFATIVVLDACRDDTGAVARAAADRFGLELTTLAGPGIGPGGARRLGMDVACERLLAAGRPRGLIACSDADSVPAPDWLERQLDHIANGAHAVGGLIELDGAEAAALGRDVLIRRERDAAVRLQRVRRRDPSAAHHHFAGASLGVTAETYRRVGGIAPLAAQEDAAFASRLAESDVHVVRAADVRVRTSARPDGRVAHGLSVDLAVASWFARRRLAADDFDLAQLQALKADTTVTVLIPTKECAETIAGVIETTVDPLADWGLVDDVVVVDADSADGTAIVAAACGARVIQQDAICGELGPALGKGDAMWRGLQATGGEFVCFLDGDTADPDPAHLRGLLGPLLSDASLHLVKGTFDRPLRAGGVTLDHEGGRVTELMARPLLNLLEPRLAGFTQPLAGEFAARRKLLESVAFPVGYGIEVAVLIDALRLYGLDALAECHLGVRQNRHQPLRALGEMAYAVLAAVDNRRDGRTAAPDAVAGVGRYLRPWDDGRAAMIEVAERPPISEWRLRRDPAGPIVGGADRQSVG
jgi:glycosyltransferase involved in cell wall biosynthesis